MIVKRSSHMPITTEIEAMVVPRIVRVLLIARIVKGMTKQRITIAQKWGANSPVNFDQKTVM